MKTITYACDKCGEPISSDNWEDSMRKCKIELSSSFHLWENLKVSESSEAIKNNFIDDLTQREATICWGEEANAQLCAGCHDKFIKLVGEFIKGEKL